MDRWISQFPEEERIVVLTETNRLLEQNYVDQAKFMEWEMYIETNADIVGENPQKTISRSQFLDIQTKGNSQKRLVPMVESYLQACGYTGVNTCAPGEVRNYFYLDDCLFTGMTLLKYARLLEQYFQKVKKCSEDINFVPIHPWCVDTLVSWCEIRNPWSSEQKDVGVIAAVKFEKVFEWLIGWLYRNQLHLSGNEVLYDSFILRREKRQQKIYT